MMQSMDFDIHADDLIPLNTRVSKIFATTQDESPHLQALLKKNSPALFKKWQVRMVILENHQLKYFKKKKAYGGKKSWENTELAGVLNFDLYWCKLFKDRSKDLIFVIRINGLERQFDFMCESKTQYEQWVFAIEQTISMSDGKKK